MSPEGLQADVPVIVLSPEGIQAAVPVVVLSPEGIQVAIPVVVLSPLKEFFPVLRYKIILKVRFSVFLG